MLDFWGKGETSHLVPRRILATGRQAGIDLGKKIPYFNNGEGDE